MFDLLVVDDDEVDILALRKAVKRHEGLRRCKLHTAKSGKEALKLLSKDIPLKPALIILDINMPGMGGLQFLDNLRAGSKYKNARVLVLTTSADAGDVAAANSKCVVGYITKTKAGNYKDLAELIYQYCELTEI